MLRLFRPMTKIKDIKGQEKVNKGWKDPGLEKIRKQCHACSADVLLVRANVIRSPSFIRPAMFDLELEWTLAPIYFSPQPFAVIKIKDGGHKVTNKRLNTRMAPTRD